MLKQTGGLVEDRGLLRQLFFLIELTRQFSSTRSSIFKPKIEFNMIRLNKNLCRNLMGVEIYVENIKNYLIGYCYGTSRL